MTALTWLRDYFEILWVFTPYIWRTRRGYAAIRYTMSYFYMPKGLGYDRCGSLQAYRQQYPRSDQKGRDGNVCMTTTVNCISYQNGSLMIMSFTKPSIFRILLP